MPQSNAITRLTCFEKQYHIYENSYLCDMSVQPFCNWSCNLKNLRNFTFKSSNKKMHHGQILRQGLNDNIMYT
jgi:hypothetical protein